MEDLDGLKQQLPAGVDPEALRSLAELPETKRLGERFDAALAAQALQNGDGNALAALVKTLLATPEGKALSEKLSGAGAQP